MKKLLLIKIKILLSILILTFKFSVKAHKDSNNIEEEFQPIEQYFIPSKELIEQNLKQQFNEVLNENLNDLQKPNLLHLISGISFTYKTDVIKRSHGLIMSFNLLKLLDLSNLSRQYKLRVKKINFKNKVCYQKQLQDIYIMLESLKKYISMYNNHIKIFKLKASLYNIEKKDIKKEKFPQASFSKNK